MICTSMPRLVASSEKFPKSPTTEVPSGMPNASTTGRPQMRAGPASEGEPQM